MSMCADMNQISFDVLCPSFFHRQSIFRCYVDIRKDAAMIVHDVNGVVMIIVASLSGLLYLGVWAQISRTKKQLESARGPDDNQCQLPGYQRTAKILVCFVVAYLAQWWPMVVYPIWSYYETPHIAMIVLIVLFCNQGGVFNFFAYTFIRRIGVQSLGTATPVRSTSGAPSGSPGETSFFQKRPSSRKWDTKENKTKKGQLDGSRKWKGKFWKRKSGFQAVHTTEFPKPMLFALEISKET